VTAFTPTRSVTPSALTVGLRLSGIRKTLKRQLLLAALFFPMTVVYAADLYIAPGGSDEATGTKEHPFATLEKARDALRLKKSSGLPAGGVTVHVGAGRYSLDKPFVLTPEDSGTEEAPIVYSGDGTHPLITAGRRITGWHEVSEGLWAADLPEVKSGQWYFEQLFVNGRRATRARNPKEGYYYMDLNGGMGADPKTGKLKDFSHCGFHALHDSDIKDFSGLSGTALNDVTLTVLWNNWISTKVRVASVDPKSRLVTLTGTPHEGQHSFFERGTRYVVENCSSALDSPGEWFLNRDGTLLYKPLPGEDMTVAEVFAPRLEQFLILSGDPKGRKFVENITFRGLSFQHAECPTPADGMPCQQSASVVPASIIGDGVRSIDFEDCEIAHVGGYAMHLRNGCSECMVRHCYLHDLGAGGIHLGGTEGNKMSADWEQSSHFTVDNNIIRSGGRVHPSGSAILSHHCSDSFFSHNDIADFYYIAISVGWTWGFAPSLAKRNRVEFNRIGWIGENVLSDLAGIYTLGQSQGTEIIGNVIHDVTCQTYGGHGIYNDEGSSGIHIANNLTYRTESCGYFMHYGKDETIENNIFAMNADHVVGSANIKDNSATFTRNIVWFNRGDALQEGWRLPGMKTSNNLYWDSSTKEVSFLGMSLAKWQALGKDQGSVVADPLFVDPEKFDFRLRQGSPALKVGFVPFDYSQAGVQGDSAWLTLASNFTPPPLQAIAPLPEFTPLTLHEDFESIPIGAPPIVGKIEPDWKSDQNGMRVSVVAEPSPSGVRCLKMVKEKPGLKDWQPMLLYSPEHRHGHTHLSFDTKLQRDGQLSLNMEDRSRKGQSIVGGPYLLFKQGKLTSLGLKPILIPWDHWIHVDVEVGVGEQANGTFDLTVAWEGAPAQQFSGIKYRSSEWNYLNWMAFSSMGAGNSTVYLDNILLTNKSSR